MGPRIINRMLTVFVSFALLLAASVLSTGSADAAPVVNSRSADAVRAAYREYMKHAAVPVGWTGNTSGCVAGATSSAYQGSILARVNIMRGLAGLEPVSFTAPKNAEAQAAALIMSANDTLDHHPDSSMRCYSEAGARGAGRSNLYISWGYGPDNTPDPIGGYMDDDGDHNISVGHRWWILRPQTTTMGSGSTSNANALWVVDVDGTRTSKLVGWPSAGYFPSEFVPTSRRWSVQTTGLGSVAAAAVKVTGPSGALTTRVIHREGDRLVWEMPSLPQVEGQGAAKYTVTITGISGGASATHSYDVNLIDGSWVDVYTTPGTHKVGGRDWRTTCEPYSSTTRCRTEIQATQIALENGRYVQRTGWVFNNLTYLPSPRSIWKGNPVGGNGVVGYNQSWNSSGRQWRTECDTATSGRGGCRAYIMATVIEVNPAGGYRTVNKWLFNNIVRFS